ncbi:MAG: DEAD/DEAH box helicase [Nanopusillaceae archaeon]
MKNIPAILQPPAIKNSAIDTLDKPNKKSTYRYYKGCLFFHINEDSVFDTHNNITIIKGYLTYLDKEELNSSYKEININLGEKDTPEFLKSYCRILNPIQGLFFKVCSSIGRKPFSVIVSSPTSSGKTGIILLYINHLFSILNKTQETLPKKFLAEECPRIVYVAPLKSLVSEKYEEFRKVFGDIVDIRTGDINKTEIKNPILVCTPDYLNLAFRNKLKFTKNIWAIIIDEVHTVLTGGVTLDEILYFTKKKELHFLLLSATIPKLDNLIEFTSPNIVIKSLWTPVKLEKRYKLATEEKDIKKSKGTNLQDELDLDVKITNIFAYNLFEEALNAIEKGEARKIIIFTYSKNLGWDIVRVAAESYNFKVLNDPDTVPFDIKPSLQEKVEKQIKKAEEVAVEKNEIVAINQDNQIEQRGIKGLKDEEKLIAFHCADLDLKERITIERSFRSKDGLRILVATQTLAYGVNLPADMVIIGINNLPNGKLIPSLIDCVQMAGRAGRFGISDKGIVTFMFKNRKNLNKAKDLLENIDSDYNVSIQDPNILFQIIFFNLSEEKQIRNLKYNSFLFNNLAVKPDMIERILHFLSLCKFITFSTPKITEPNNPYGNTKHIELIELTPRGKFCYSQNVFPPHFFLSEILSSRSLNALRNTPNIKSGHQDKISTLNELFRRNIIEFLSFVSLYQGSGKSTLKYVCDTFENELKSLNIEKDHLSKLSYIIENSIPAWHQSHLIIQILRKLQFILLQGNLLEEVSDQLEFVLSLTAYVSGTYYLLGIPKGFSDVSYTSPSSFLHLVRVLFLANKALEMFDPLRIKIFLYSFWYKVLPMYLDLVLLFKATASELKKDFGAAKKLLLINAINKFIYDLKDFSIGEYVVPLLEISTSESESEFIKKRQESLYNLVYLIRKEQELFLNACNEVMELHLTNREKVRGKINRERILENYRVIKEVTEKIMEKKTIKVSDLYNDPFVKTTINKVTAFFSK